MYEILCLNTFHRVLYLRFWNWFFLFWWLTIVDVMKSLFHHYRYFLEKAGIDNLLHYMFISFIFKVHQTTQLSVILETALKLLPIFHLVPPTFASGRGKKASVFKLCLFHRLQGNWEKEHWSSCNMLFLETY